MKKLVCFTLYYALFCSSLSLAQEVWEETESAFSSHISYQVHDVLAVKPMRGCTKIVPTFVGNWTPSQKGAFKAACQLWEEAMPSNFPIRVEARMTPRNSNATANSPLSKVSIRGRRETQLGYGLILEPHFTTQAKGTTFGEFMGEYDTRRFIDVLDSSYFEMPDFKITYYAYNNMDDVYSYALDGSLTGDKYDFVTCAMRDIGHGLGLVWTQRKAINNQLQFSVDSLTYYYELSIGESLYNSTDGNPALMYQLATNDTLKVFLDHSQYNLYAPPVWDTYASLNYFYPDNSKKFTQLLSYDFGRGTVVRDISDNATYNMFKDILNWKGDIAIGISDNSPIHVGSTFPYNSDAIPANGVISMSSGITGNRNVQKFNNRQMRNLFDYSDFPEIVLKYHPNYSSEIDGLLGYGYSVSLMKEDGTWDVVYYEPLYFEPLNISVSDFSLNDSIEAYARSFDGLLKCRITNCYPGEDETRIMVRYALIEASPLKADVDPQQSRITRQPYDEYDYTMDIRLDLGNLEGVSRVVVSQLDEGADIPYIYEVPNFRKGYFNATVDIEYPTEFTIYYHNETGSSQRTITYDPILDSNNIVLSFQRENSFINVLTTGRLFDRGIIDSVSVTDFLSGNKENNKISFTGNRIDIDKLKPGTYILNVSDKKGGKHSYKFSK